MNTNSTTPRGCDGCSRDLAYTIRVVVDNDKPVAIAICIGPGLHLVISLDGTLHPAGPITYGETLEPCA